MYCVGLNLYQNINSKRYGLYKTLLNNATKNGCMFSYDDILCFGKELGLSSKYVNDEIIGCLYANFITRKSEQYKLTERAMRDFSLYESETMYKTAEIPYTIDFLNKDIKISFYHLSGMQNTMAEQHKEKKWNYNHSLNRIMHKCKSIDAASELLASSLSTADSYLKLNCLSFTEFMREYGHKYSNSSQPIYSVDMNFRGLFKSKSVDIFESTYLKIKENFINPVDWGGKPFTIDSIPCDSSIKDSFLISGLDDGMLRPVDNYRYTLTGHAAVIIDSVKNKYNNHRLSVIVRKEQLSYSLWVGNNSRYPERFKEYFRLHGFLLSGGWFVCKEYSKMDHVICSLNAMIRYFYSLYSEFTI